jgi:hypothetical protein
MLNNDKVNGRPWLGSHDNCKYHRFDRFHTNGRSNRQALPNRTPPKSPENAIRAMTG